MADTLELTTEQLRTRAKELGIKFTKNTSDDTLIDKIEKAEAERAPSVNITASKTSAKALKRVKIIPNNPLERDLPCKLFCVCNRVITLKKVVQFDTPIFLENGVIECIKEQKYVHVKDNTEGDNLTGKPEPVFKDAYTVLELHTPTEEEWNKDTEWVAMKNDKKLKDAAHGVTN